MALGLFLSLSWETIVQSSIDALSLGSLYALFALGIALIFGVMGLINFAHGELVMVGAFTAALLSFFLPALVIVMVLVPVAFALAMERIAFRPLRGASPATLLVASFAVSIVLQNGAEMAFGALPRGTNISTELTEAFTVGSIVIPKLSVLTVGLTAFLLVGLVGFLRLTQLGVEMRAAAENFSMARLMGVRANRVVAAAFAVSGFLAGVASLLVVAQTGTVSPTMGVNVVVIAFVATILGGIGSLLGAVIGGFIVGSLTIALQTALPFELLPFRDGFVFALVLAMLVLRPQGLIVARAYQQRV
jgi:branched-chain amino acid transport system permease protein